MREERTDVLVVGAGPVGLWTALLLAEAGLEVTIIDRETRTTTRSYACALHPRTLALLQPFGLTERLLQVGRRVQTIGFYDGESRRAQLDLSALGGDFPYLLLLPQSDLESLLEQRLRQKGVAVRWNHRFDGFKDEEEVVAATVEELSGTSTGYIVPHWETVVKDRWPIRAEFLLGTDGHHSPVRQRLGIENERVAGPYFFAAFEFVSGTAGQDELKVVLDEASTNALWPLPGNKCRWTFQRLRASAAEEFPEKERRAVRVARPTVDEQVRQFVEKVARQRAPWFTAEVKEVTWCTEVVFEQRLAREFGRSRCWLAGDAAHQTGPVGVQSLNLGFREAETLAGLVQKIVRENAPLQSLAAYGARYQAEWRRLLGLSGGLSSAAATDPWVRQRSARLLPCLPATGEDVAPLARQLKMSFSS